MNVAVCFKESSSLESGSGWVPALLALMYEYTNTNSKWQPYLQLIPNFDQLDLPMFWKKYVNTINKVLIVNALPRNV